MIWDIIGIDTGGTFTDSIAISAEKIEVIKIPSTPSDPKQAVISSVEKLKSSREILHGTTVATNAVIQRKGAKVALITTKGFKDIIEIGRQNRDNIYSLYPTRPIPLVPAELRFEVEERIIANGSVELALTEKALDKLESELKAQNFDSIAICTIFSFLNNDHESRILARVQNLAPTSVSSEVFPEYREYERMSTTVMDAYVKPIVSEYLSSLEQILLSRKFTDVFAVMKSSKGLARGNSTAEFPVHTLFSGLAAGIKAAEFTSKILGIPNLLSLDIGGTSTDVAAITEGKNSILQTLKVGGLPVSVPAIDVETIGAGGGSLIEIIAGLIRVGPQSAGALPGPVAYDLGGIIPTVTDADLSFGILPEQLAGGELIMKHELAIKAMSKLSNKLDLTLSDTVKGVRRIFHENIASALRSVSTQRGLDPRKYALLAFGGAGPVHGCELAEIMGIDTVIIPPIPGAWSAMGLIGSDYSYSINQGYIRPLEEIDLKYIDKVFSDMELKAQNQVLLDGLTLERKQITKSVAMRFTGQSFELEVDYSPDKNVLKQSFLGIHQLRYGFAAADEPVEFVACRLILVIPHDDPNLPIVPSLDDPKKITEVTVLDREHKVPVYNKTDLGFNFSKEGPLLIHQLDTTIWIPENWKISVDQFGFIIANRV